MKKVIFIDGMSCDKCKQRVEEMFRKQREVKKVEVSLRERKAELELNRDMSEKQIRTLIEDLGYKLRKIEG